MTWALTSWDRISWANRVVMDQMKDNQTYSTPNLYFHLAGSAVAQAVTTFRNSSLLNRMYLHLNIVANANESTTSISGKLKIILVCLRWNSNQNTKQISATANARFPHHPRVKGFIFHNTEVEGPTVLVPKMTSKTRVIGWKVQFWSTVDTENLVIQGRPVYNLREYWPKSF